MLATTSLPSPKIKSQLLILAARGEGEGAFNILIRNFVLSCDLIGFVSAFYFSSAGHKDYDLFSQVKYVSRSKKWSTIGFDIGSTVSGHKEIC